MANLSFRYGTSSILFDVPDKNLLKVLEPNDVPPLKDLKRGVEEALRNPIGTKRLREIVRKGERVAIVINDITRPVPNDQILPVVLEELEEGGIQAGDTVVVIANGVHRPNTPDEIRQMVGSSINDSLKIYNHDAFDPTTITTMGKTAEGIPVSLNRHVAQADRRILISAITPHHAAGYSGGRKSIFPGVSSYETLKMLHGMEPVRPLLGELKGNPLHQNALEAARIAGVDFIVNVVPNGQGKTCGVVAGHLERAWERGVALCDCVCRRKVPQKADIIITSPGGFPKDIDLRQSQKAVSVAEMVVKENGTIILVSRCSDGIGREDLYELLKSAGSPQKVIEKFRKIGFTPSSRKAYMFVRAMLKARIVVVTEGIAPEKLREMMLEPASSVEEAVEWSFKRLSGGAKIVAIPRADQLIPVVE